MPEKRGGEFLRGLAWNVPASIGAPADLAETVLNLGLAGGGYLGHKLGLLGADQLPQLLEGSPGTTKWWAKGTPMAESADPAFVRGQLTGGLAAAAYGMLPQMRMRQGQVNAVTWHGSPYKFDAEQLVRLPDGSEVYIGGRYNQLKEAPPGSTLIESFPLGRFRAEGIGTGEGAQAYGHGHYLADLGDVAKNYMRGQLSMQNIVESGGKFFIEGPGKEILAGPFDKKADAAIRLQAVGAKAANLYKVDLPDEAIARMLDWNKPLSQQPGMVQKVFDNAWQHSLYRKRTGVDVGDFKGADLVNAMGADSHSRALFADDMRKAGIPGIRYLDGGSRAADSGSYNYVVFPGEEGLLRILERNGAPLQQGLAAGPVLQKGLAKP